MTTSTTIVRIVHGSDVNAEFLPWHFKANILKTTLRFEEPRGAFASVLSTLVVSQQEPHFLLSITAQLSGLIDPYDLVPEVVLLQFFSQHVFRESQQVDLGCSVSSPKLEPFNFLFETLPSLAGLWTYEGGVTPFVSAQANLSAGVKQQQLVQHSSAVLQPQGQFWQGNG